MEPGSPSPSGRSARRDPEAAIGRLSGEFVDGELEQRYRAERWERIGPGFALEFLLVAVIQACWLTLDVEGGGELISELGLVHGLGLTAALLLVVHGVTRTPLASLHALVSLWQVCVMALLLSATYTTPQRAETLLFGVAFATALFFYVSQNHILISLLNGSVLCAAFLALAAPLLPSRTASATMLLAGLLIAFLGARRLNRARRLEYLQTARLRAQASHDALTGICNRRSFFERGSKLVAVARRHDQALSLLMLDIDHFKRINDTYGHAGGDQALVRLTEALADACRTTDLLGRIGGEEFALLLPLTGSSDAEVLAERIRERIKHTLITTDKGAFDLAASIGVAGLSQDDETLDALMARADEALYRAKAAGRDRVERDFPTAVELGSSLRLPSVRQES